MNVTTPSGLSGRIRKLKGREANHLADKRLAAKGEVFDTVLAALWQGTDDPGPYPELATDAGRAVPWGSVLVCDRFYTLVAARIATYGPEYVFPVQCLGNTGCDHRFEWVLDLEKDLPVYDLPEESRAKITAGDNRFEATADGRRIEFCLLDGRREKKMGQAAATMKGELVTRSIASRILSVEDIKGKGRFFRDAVNEWLLGVDMDEQIELLGEMEAVDGGFKTDLEIQCPKCDRIFEIDVPFEGAAFWMPRSKKRISTKAARPMRTMAGEEIED